MGLSGYYGRNDMTQNTCKRRVSPLHITFYNFSFFTRSHCSWSHSVYFPQHKASLRPHVVLRYAHVDQVPDQCSKSIPSPTSIRSHITLRSSAFIRTLCNKFMMIRPNRAETLNLCTYLMLLCSNRSTYIAISQTCKRHRNRKHGLDHYIYVDGASHLAKDGEAHSQPDIPACCCSGSALSEVILPI